MPARSWSTILSPVVLFVVAFAPTIEAIAEQFEGRADVAKLDIDQNPETAAAYGIRSIPTVLIFRGGQEVDRIVGLQPRARYEQALEAAGATP